MLDILLRGGRVVDPLQGIDEVLDIGIAGGRIACCGREVAGEGAREVVDCRGYVITPGLIDFHAHFFWQKSSLGIFPDPTYLPTGVTGAVEAGSAGVADLELLLLSLSQTIITSRALVYLFPEGLEAAVGRGEVAAADVERLAREIAAHRDRLLGVKLRLSRGVVPGDGLELLRTGLEAAERSGTRLVVHVTNPPCPLEEILQLLRPGDIVAHVYHGRGDTILDPAGRIKEQVWAARKRGVFFDAANGNNHFSFEVARKAIEQGFLPDVISTDLTAKTMWLPKVYNLPHVLSKYLAMGLSLGDCIYRASTVPARLMGLGNGCGTLKEGSAADVAVFKMERAGRTYYDSAGAALTASTVLVPVLTVKSGVIVYRSQLL